MRWRVITSTISFGKYVEVQTGIVWAATEEAARDAVSALGWDRLLGFKFQRVEATR